MADEAFKVRTQRTPYQIVARILKVSTKGIRTTDLCYETRLNHRVLLKHLAMALENGLLNQRYRHPSVWYFTTSRGRTFLRRYRELEGMLPID